MDPIEALSAAAAPHIVIAGAGVCGLYAARTLVAHGLRVTVLEAESIVGGLAAGHERAGNHYDLGAHHLHAFDEAIFQDIKGIMGEALIPSEKVALIRYGRGYRRYPLEFWDLLTGIPPWTLLLALLGLLWQQVANRRLKTAPANAEEALIRLYGRPLYRFFFRDFTHRYWGFPPAQMSATFVRSKMPRLSAVDIVKKALGRLGVAKEAGETVEAALAEETLWYSRTGSREMPMALAAFIRDHGGTVLTEAPLRAIETEAGRVRAVRHGLPDGGEARLACDGFINTTPLPSLPTLFRPAPPPDVIEAGARLRYRPMVVYGLLVRRERVLSALYVYFRERSFHRIAEPSASGMEVRPPGHTVLLCELMCEVGDARWNGDPAVERQLVADLEAEGLLRADEIVEVHRIHSRHAYPVFDLGFEPHLEAVNAYLAGFANLLSVGRQGGYCFPNMHGAMRMGAEAAVQMAQRMRRGTPDRSVGAAAAPQLDARSPAEPDRAAPSPGAPDPVAPPLAEPELLYLPDGDLPAAVEAEQGV